MSNVPRIGPASGPFEDPGEDETAVLLRGALFREAERVTSTPDGLQRIQRQIRTGQVRRPGPWLGRLTPALTAAAAVAVLAVAGAVAVRLNQQATSGAPANPPPATAMTTPETTANSLPVYVVGMQDGNKWLFREYRSTYTVDVNQRVAEAITDAVSLTPLDPDYNVRLFRGGSGGKAQARVSRSQITITLTAAMVSNTGVSRADAELAVQQLVWTATAAAGPGYASAPVKIEVAGGKQRLFDVLSLDRMFARASGPSDPRAPLWIISLSEGTDVGHKPLTVTGDARLGDGGTVTWTLTRDTVVVAEGTATPGHRLGTRTSWEVHLPPGRTAQKGEYRLAVALRPGSGSGLSPGSGGLWQDTRDFVVR